MTLLQIKQDIRSGKSKRIYLSSVTLWWTHLDSDVKEATERGKEYQKRIHEKRMNDDKIPAEEKARLNSLFNYLQESRAKQEQFFKDAGIKNSIGIPLDPTGSPLLQNDNPMKWVTASESKPSHFGIKGLKAFVFSHHQNCSQFFSNKWADYNEYMIKNNL
jgi:hypothetical protein